MKARATACGTRLKQIGVGIELYVNDYDRTLPQVLVPGFDGSLDVVAQLFGGKKGALPLFGINEIGPSGRPLNPYVGAEGFPPDADTPHGSYDTPSAIEIEVFRSPLDRGMGNTTLPPSLGPDSVDSVYDFLGSSYTLNDHGLDANPFDEELPTLVPEGGGRMPPVADTARTWVVGSMPIYAYDDGSDRQLRWQRPNQEIANLLFLDGHVRVGVSVPEGQVNTTPDYTFLPTPDASR